MSDNFGAYNDAVDKPARDAFAVTPHDTNELTTIPKALFIGTGGILVLRGVAGASDVTFENIQDGSILPVRARYVRATGTTASDIVGLV